MTFRYQFTFPTIPEVPGSLRKFFERFNQISDTPKAHEEYADAFTKDAVLMMASAKVKGREGGCDFSSRSCYNCEII